MDTHEFEQLVADVLESLPPEFASRMENIAVIVEQRPTPEQRRKVGLKPGHVLYGLYEGVPLTRRRAWSMTLPSVITIFQEPLERAYSNPDALRDKVRRTVLHEVAHHFGISDARLHELGAY